VQCVSATGAVLLEVVESGTGGGPCTAALENPVGGDADTEEMLSTSTRWY